MRFDVYCDESRPELFTSRHPESRLLVIGSLWLPTACRQKAKEALHALRHAHRVGPEAKWQKVSNSRLAFYVDVVRWFARNDDLRFRCIAVDREQVDLVQFHETDGELGFYKFYYQLLHHWILDFNEYAVFGDAKSTRRRGRLADLERCLNYANLSSSVRVQGIHSHESVLIQLADILTGAASARLNSSGALGSARSALLEQLEASLGRKISPTTRGEKKFNVFKINLGVGWDNKKKREMRDRRVAIVNTDYVVILHNVGRGKAEFLTAWVGDTDTLMKIRSHDRWA